MPAVVASFLALALGWALGSVPAGSWLVRRAAGVDPREVNPHLIGVENLYRTVGGPVAVASFALDTLKGMAAVVLAGGNPWAALGVYLGHLYPVPLGRRPAPRGRGNGVLLGILAGLSTVAGTSWLVLAIPVAVYAALLAAPGYVVLATVAGLASLAAGAALASALHAAPAGLAWALAALASVGIWRQKAALARVRDGTEARLGEPPSVRGMDPGTVLCAFLVHPLTLDDLWQPPSQRWLGVLARRGLLPERLVTGALPLFRPQSQGLIEGIVLPDGRSLRVLLIAGPMLPSQIRERPETATRMAILGARLAHELGAEAVGLGAFWSTVGDKGRLVQDAVPDIAITNGGAYTAATVRSAVPGLLARFAAEGGSLRRATAAVVGANGVVAFGVARMIAGEVGELILVGRDAERVARSAETLRRKHPETRIHATTDLSAVAAADLVFSATSDPEPVLFPDHIKPGAWIFDLGRPADVGAGVRDVPGVHVVPGGVVRPPGAMRSKIDMRFGDGLLPACLAETMIMTATRAYDRRSLGPRTRTADIEFYLREGERLGFEIVTRDASVAELETAP